MKPGQRSWPNMPMLALVVLIGLNLRPFLTGPGPVLPLITDDLGLSLTAASTLTLLPMVLMGLGAFVSPGLQARLGARRGLLLAISILGIGSLARLVAFNGSVLIASAALCGAGAAFAQSAFPAIIKQRFPGQIATVTGLYSAMIMGGGAFGAWLTATLAKNAIDWRVALAWLAALALPALVGAYLLLPRAESEANSPGALPTGKLLRRPRIWALMAAFGLINSGYSSMVAWLAPYYQALGWTGVASAQLVAIMALAQAAAALGLPVLARKRIDRRPWLFLTIALQAIGFAGLAFAPSSAPYLWAILCGAGLGGSFALAIVTALDHSPVPQEAGAVAALMQGGGFLIAALGPYAMAVLHDASGSFASGWMMHLLLVTITAVIYLRFNPKNYRNALVYERPFASE